MRGNWTKMFVNSTSGRCSRLIAKEHRTFELGENSNMFPYMSQFPKIDKNLSIFLAVNFLDDSVENHVKVARINFDSFVGNVGGGLGLCLGFSMVSTVFLVFDMVNNAIKRCFCLQNQLNRDQD